MSADLTWLVFLPNADTTANTHNLRSVDRHVVKCPQLSFRASVLWFCWILLNILFMQAKIENYIVNFCANFAICLCIFWQQLAAFAVRMRFSAVMHTYRFAQIITHVKYKNTRSQLTSYAKCGESQRAAAEPENATGADESDSGTCTECWISIANHNLKHAQSASMSTHCQAVTRGASWFTR